MSHGTPAKHDPTQAEEHPSADQQPEHGSSGEGASSAMARLISQEQARIVPGNPEDAPTGSS